MYLLPLLLSAWWTDRRVMERDLALAGISPDDSILSRPLDRYYPNLRDQTILDFYYRPWTSRRKDGAAMMGIASDNDNFKVVIDVRQFKPEEITVKVVGRCIVVEAKHEEKRDEHGSISRQFLRKYLLPDRADLDEVSSTVSSDGILIITASLKKRPEEPKERVIKIQQTGRPALRSSAEDEGRSTTEKKTVEDNEIRESTTRSREEEEAKPQK